jgi:cysteine desulfurase
VRQTGSEKHKRKPTVYLDNNATTKVAPEVLDAMLPFLSTYYGNPSSMHSFGGGVKKSIDHARENVAALIGARPAQIYFTGCGSESDNMVIQGFFNRHKNRTRIITSTVEHPAVRNLCRYLKTLGAEVFEVAVDEQGTLDYNRLSSLPMDEDTLLSFMWANNETGVLFPIEKIAALAKEHGAFFHTDAVQAAGKVGIDVLNTPVDFLALSGHKLHAPKGIGVTFIRDSTELVPLIVGGHQEGGARAGTENVASIIGLGKACELAMKHFSEEQEQVRTLRDKLEQNLLAKCMGAKLNGDPGNRLPNTTNISFEFIEGEGILLHLDEHGICASSGSACTTGSLEPSHVLRAMDVPYTLAHSSTRFSLSRYTTEAEIDAVVEVMPSIVERLRSLSPYVKS